MRKQEREMEYALELPRALPRKHATMQAVHPADAADADLLVSIAGGDRDAFETLYRRYARPVLGLALRRLGDRGRAEDAVQETFTAVWRAARSYRPERGPGAPWLYAVARNAIADRGRTRPEPPAEAPDAPTSEPGPPERAEADWVSWRVHAALEQLPEREQAVLQLAYWSGLSQSEVANFLNVPLGTVKTRTRSGLAHLSELLQGELG